MRTGQDGRAPRRRRSATAAVTGPLAALAVLAGCGALGSDEPEPPSEAAVTTEAGTDTSPIAVGDCIDDPGLEKHSDIPVIPCNDLHVFEAFAATRMPDGDYPGQGEVNAFVSDFCAEEFRSFIGVDYDASVLELLSFYPVEESWNAEEDREILCFVAEPDETPVTGTLQDAGR